MCRVVHCKQTTRNNKMKFRIFILSVACLSSLAPPAQGTLHALKAAAAVGALAIKGAAIKGAIEGAAAKTAALLSAKGAIVKGALSLASQAANLAVHGLPPVKPVILDQPAVVVPSVVPANAVFVKTSPPRLPPVSNSLASLLNAAHLAAQHKIATVSALASLHQPSPVVVPAPVVVESLRYPYPLTALHLIDNDC